MSLHSYCERMLDAVSKSDTYRGVNVHLGIGKTLVIIVAEHPGQRYSWAYTEIDFTRRLLEDDLLSHFSVTFHNKKHRTTGSLFEHMYLNNAVVNERVGLRDLKSKLL